MAEDMALLRDIEAVDERLRVVKELAAVKYGNTSMYIEIDRAWVALRTALHLAKYTLKVDEQEAGGDG